MFDRLARWYGLLRSRVIYNARPWRDRSLREHYRPFLTQGSLAFDIGAHVGNRSRTFADLGATVVALEPNPYLARWLSRRLAGVAYSITVVPRAVGARSGTTTLYLPPSNPTIATTSADWATRAATLPGWSRHSFDETISVEVTTLAELQRTFGEPDFVKIDVEGGEAAVIAGMGRPVAALSFEFLPDHPEVCLEALRLLEERAQRAGLRYSYNISLGEELSFVWNDEWQPVERVRDFVSGSLASRQSGDIYARLIER